MLTNHREKGEIIRVEGCPVQGRYSIFGNPQMKDLNARHLPQGTYYIIEEKEDTNEYLVGEIEYLQGGFYLLGKRDTYYVPVDSIEEMPLVDKVPAAELEEVRKFLSVFQQAEAK